MVEFWALRVIHDHRMLAVIAIVAIVASTLGGIELVAYALRRN